MSTNTEWTDNPYYNPDKCGLSIVAELEEPDMCYEFNQIILWRHIESGGFYAAADSGCSCPTPFDEFKRLGDLVPIDSVASLQSLVDKNNGYDPFPAPLVADFIAKARDGGLR